MNGRDAWSDRVWLRPIGTALVGGLAVGALTAVAQGLLPDVLAPMANSAGSWCLAAFLLALTTRRAVVAAIAGAIALIAMVLGYAVASEVSGNAAGLRLVLFWGAAAVVVGPPIGIAAAWIRGGDPPRAAFGLGLVSGILIGEAVYGLTIIATTTPTEYWTGQLVIGLGVVLVAGALLLRHAGSRFLALGAAGAIAAAIYAVYAANPIQFFA